MDTVLAIAAIVLVVVGARVRAGAQGPPPVLVDDVVDDAPPAGRRSAHARVGTALEIAGGGLLTAAVVVATVRHRDDIDLHDFTVTALAAVAVVVVLAVGRWRASRAAATETRR